MKHFIVTFIIATALFCTAVSAQAQRSIKPATVYKQDGIAIVSPNQPGWTLLKADKSETVFEKSDENGIVKASVKIIQTGSFETDKERLAVWEAFKQVEFNKFRQDHLHFNYQRFKGATCLRYDAIFPLDKTSENKFAHFNVNGYLLPLPNAKDSAIQIEISNYSDTRGLTEAMYSLADEFYEKLTVPKPQ